MANPDRERNIRLVLLGNVGAGKSATGNTLLGDALFTSKISPSLVTKQCEAQSVTRGGRRVTVVDTPGLTAKMVTETAKENLLRCLQLSAPGPHVFLLVICLGRFTQETQDTVERAVEVFGQKLYMFSIILFTFKDSLKKITIEEFIISSGDRLQQLVQKCGSRYHAFNNENPGKEDEVGPLLMQIDKLIAANGDRWYTPVSDDMGEKYPLLGAEMDYEATPCAQKMMERRGKEEKRIKENIESEEELEKWGKWLWNQEEQLWKRSEHLREFEKHLKTSEELLYSSVGKDKEELLRQIETEKTERIKERQEMEKKLKDLKSEMQRIEAEMKKIYKHHDSEVTQAKTTLKEFEKLQNQSVTKEKRREIQLEQLQKQENDIHMEMEMIRRLTKMKQETEEEKNKNEKIVKDQSLQIERNLAELQKQKQQLETLKNEISPMKKEIQSEKRQIIRENQQIDEQREVLKRQWTEIETEKEKIQKQEVINKDLIDKQDLEKLSSEEEIKTQEALLHKLKKKMDKCEETLRRQENLKQTNKTEIQQQIIQLQEQKLQIDTQNKEIEDQKQDILKHRGIIKQTRRKLQTLKTISHTEEKEREMNNDRVQKQLSELERQKEMHEQNMTFIRIETELQKCKNLRRKEENLHTLQNICVQLEDETITSNYTQESESEIKNDLEKIIETMKTETELTSLNLTEEQIKQEISKKDELDATQDSTDTTGATLQTHKGSEENEIPKFFTSKNEGHPDSQGKKSNLKSLMELLQSLCLDDVYPHKLSKESFLSVDGLKKKQSDCSVAFIYLQKLLMLNYTARFITEANLNQDSTHCIRRGGKYNTDADFVPDAMEDNDDASAKCETVVEDISQVGSEMQEIPHMNYLFDELFSENNDSEGRENIHPMDVQMAVFHCADNFLKQHIVNKLSSCQYALPLLVPNPLSSDIELPLWTFRQINKTCSSTDGSSKSTPVIQLKTPMVFFCRLGSVSTSKSQLLNSLINPKHDAFIHRDSPGSSRSSLFKDGLVEIAWYCPAGNSDDLFSACIAFCNLHGDAAEYRQQTDFLAEISTVTVVLMENMKPDDKGRELLQMFYKSPKPLICLVSDQQKAPPKISNGINMKIVLKDRNKDQLRTELTGGIKMCLNKCKISPTFSLEGSTELAKRQGFRVDEDCKDCQKGKDRAFEIMKLLNDVEHEDISQVKSKLLPCHGNLWHEWTKKNKELHRLHGGREDFRQDELMAEMSEIRAKQQGKSLTCMKNVAKQFLSSSKTQTQYLVQWVKVFIDDKFSDTFSQLHLKYSSKWLEIQKLKNTQGSRTEELKAMQEELEKVSEELETVTLGVEHIFREMGQIYEAWIRVPEEMGSDVSALPALAADLLISGNPLELMDGDAAHVPLIWIESVLDKVIERLGDQRVFVLSVLGLQSTGKSTLLNTMFGLQFAVSAGRCTRGAFMQLIRVKEEAKEELKFDYILVVDTEGLQALELAGKSTINHDNELATFVIGLANMTLINIFGDNPAEIQEFLQIVIQAILRMNKGNLKPSCMLVRQNITDLTTADKNLEGKRRLQDKLDELTISVAKEEGLNARYFSDVIKFNIETDVHYFAQLWEGNPPMAPPNPRYSESAESLKQAVLRAASQQESVKISELKVRIKDLWTEVLNEDFVFSFKNSQDIAQYRKKITQTY